MALLPGRRRQFGMAAEGRVLAPMMRLFTTRWCGGGGDAAWRESLKRLGEPVGVVGEPARAINNTGFA